MFSSWLFLLLFSQCICWALTRDAATPVGHLGDTQKEFIISAGDDKKLSYDPELPGTHIRPAIDSYHQQNDIKDGVGHVDVEGGEEEGSNFRPGKKLKPQIDPLFPTNGKAEEAEDEDGWRDGGEVNENEDEDGELRQTIIRWAHDQEQPAKLPEEADGGGARRSAMASITSPLGGSSVMNHHPLPPPPQPTSSEETRASVNDAGKREDGADDEDVAMDVSSKGSVKTHPHRHHHHYNRYNRNQHRPKQRQFLQKHPLHYHHHTSHYHHHHHDHQLQAHYLGRRRGPMNGRLEWRDDELPKSHNAAMAAAGDDDDDDEDEIADQEDSRVFVNYDGSSGFFNALPLFRHNEHLPRQQLYVASLIDEHGADKLLISAGVGGGGETGASNNGRGFYMSEDELLMVDSGQAVTLAAVAASPSTLTVAGHDDGQLLHKALEHWPIKHESVMEGDLILGGLMMVHEREDSITCGPIMPQGGVQALETMLYTLDRVNEMKLLPDFTLGAHILDDCDKDTYGLEMAVDFIKGT